MCRTGMGMHTGAVTFTESFCQALERGDAEEGGPDTVISDSEVKDP
jgi:hypothetical protein